MSANVKVAIREHKEIKGLYILDFIYLDTNTVEASIQCGIDSLQLIHDVTGNALEIIKGNEEKLRVLQN